MLRRNCVMGILISLVSFSFFSCGEEEEKVTGSCVYDAVPYGTGTGITFKLCLEFAEISEDSKNELSSQCSSEADESFPISGTWSDAACAMETATASCVKPGSSGGTDTSYVYNADFNELLQDDPTGEEELCEGGTYTTITDPTAVKYAYSLVYKGTNLRCSDVTTRDSLADWQKSQLDSVVAALGADWSITWTKDASCSQLGAVAKCTGISSGMFVLEDKYYYGAVGSTDQSECSGSGGTYSTL